MDPLEKRLFRTYRVGGREFRIYLEYDKELQKSYPLYPDFEKFPEYTDEGRSFATAEQDSCPFCKPGTPGGARPADCGGCSWFYRERTPFDPIGICMCNLRKRDGRAGG